MTEDEIAFRMGVEKINSGHSQFDKQTNLIKPGSVLANTMYGSTIRAVYLSPLGNGGRGTLRDFDLDKFEIVFEMPEYVKKDVLRYVEKDSCWLYVFFNSSNGGTRKNHQVIHGWILTDMRHRFVKQWTTGPTYRSVWVMDAVKPLVSYVGSEA